MFKAHIKLIVLKELSKDSLSGYDLMKSLAEFGENTSPGYIYPLLNDLEKKGFVSVKEKDRKKIYSITEKGKNMLNDLKENREEMMKKMASMWKPLTDKEDLKKLVEFRQHMDKNKNFHNDMGILKKFHRTLFSAYRKSNDIKRKKLKEILIEAIKKMEKL